MYLRLFFSLERILVDELLWEIRIVFGIELSMEPHLGWICFCPDYEPPRVASNQWYYQCNTDPIF